MLQGADPPFEDLLFPPEQLGPTAAADLAFGHPATGDHPLPRDLDRHHDLDLALPNLAEGRLAQALGRALDVFRQLIDDIVVANLDLGALRRGGGCGRGLEVEADDDRVRDAGEQQVRVAHSADALADDLDRHHGVLDLLKRAEQSFESSLRVGLDHQAELLDLALLGATGELLEGDPRREVARSLRRAPLGELGQGDLAGGLFRADDLEDVTGLRDLAHAGHHDGRRRAGLGDALSAVVGKRADSTVDVTANEVVADLERACLHEHGGDGATAALEVSVDDSTDRVAVGVRLQLEDVS